MGKKFQLVQECPRGLVGISLINLWHFGHNFRTLAPDMLASQSMALKTWMTA